MSEVFKGKRGGDPNRKPPVVTVSYNCLFCLTTCEAETRKPECFEPPRTCSSECEAALIRKEAKTLIFEVLPNADLPADGDIPQRIAEEVLQAHRWYGKAQLGEVKVVGIICTHCKNPADKFTFKNSKVKNGPSVYCSFACRESKASKLPSHVVCRSPRKESHATEQEAQEIADKLNVRLSGEGDGEGVQPYACTCGKWHTGHYSKRLWLEAATTAISLLNELTAAAIAD